MGYFPIFLDLKNRPILVIGAGEVASRKIEKLLPFSPALRVIAPRVSSLVETWALEGKLELQRREFQTTDIEGFEMVIVAADDIALQKTVYDLCKSYRIPCNSVDSPAYCSFIFPALVTRGDMTIGISTGGRAPGVSAKVRALIDQTLPANISEIVNAAAQFRKSAEVKSKALFTERAGQVIQYVETLFQNKKDS